METKRRVLGAVIKLGWGLGILLLASGAAADNITTYAWPACSDWTISGNQGGAFEGASFSVPNTTYARPSTRCPLTRIVSDDTTDISTVLIRVQDNSTTQGISCYAISLNGSGDTSSVTSTQSTGNSFTGTTYLNMGSVAAYSTGYAYIYCSFPNDGTHSFVYSYRATD